MLKSLVLLVALGTAANVAAHDFWVQPKLFAVAPGTVVPLTVEVGHGAARQRWGVAPSRVASFTSVGPRGTVDRRRELHLDGPASDADLRFDGAGTHVIALISNHADSILPAIRFNDYLKVEGLTPGIEARARNGTTNRPGREIYSRRAKALVRIGSGGPSLATKALGHTLEIVPERDPYELKPGEPLVVRVLYQGRPLGGALVKLNNLDFDARPVAEQRTAADGRTVLALPFRGTWQVNVIWTKAITSLDAEFDTTFASLVFGTKG